MSENQGVKRGLLLAGFWMLGVIVAVALAFAAVGRVAHGVAPHDVAQPLSQTAIDDALAADRKPAPVPGGANTSSSTTPKSTSAPTTATTTTTTPKSGPTNPSTTTPTTAGRPTVTTVSPPPPVAPHNSATTSQGGTVFTRCSGADTIVYVAAVPRPGFTRTVDVENPGGVRQSFQNGKHRSIIEAECSNGVVHATVDEESTVSWGGGGGGDD